MRFVTHSADETEALGERLAKTLHGGEIIAFTGDLGAGKTAFTRGLARGLGIPMRVTSPTYTIVNEYTGGRLPLFHFDMYRLGSSDELFDIGWEDYLQRGGVCGAKTSRTPCRARSRCASAAIRTSSARSPSKEAGWMRILAFETSAKAASVALLEGDALLGELYLNCGLTHSRTLLESAQRLLEITELTAKDIDAVACAAGPGSFTGVRIGVAAAKGFAWGRDIPCCGVSTLEAMAWQVSEFSGIVCCAMDARRSQVYHARFLAENGTLTRLCPDCAVSLDEVRLALENCEKPKIMVGDGAQLCYNTFGTEISGCMLAPEHRRMQRASGVALAARRLLGEGADCSGAALAPNYLRLSQAERERAERLRTSKESVNG